MMEYLVLVLCLSGLATARFDYTGYRVYGVTPADQNDVEVLSAIRTRYDREFDFWSEGLMVGREVLVSVAPDNVPLLETQLRARHLRYRIAFRDLEQLHEEQRQEAAEKPAPDPYNIDFERYHRHDTYNTWLDHIAGVCGSRCTVSNIGTSYEGRTMRMIKIVGSGSATSSVFVDATHHAREWIAPATIIWFINVFVRQYGQDPEVTAAVDKFDWYFVPIANPDGYEYTHDWARLWRKTRRPSDDEPDCIGADPNRNYDFMWGGQGASPDPCSDTYRGDSPFSEPETRVIRDAFNNAGRQKPVRGYVSLHSSGSMWLTVWGYSTADPPNYSELLRVGDAAADRMYEVDGNVWEVGSAAQILYVAAGGSDDWAYAVGGATYAYTPELPGWGWGFELPEYLIRDVLDELTPGFLTMAAEMAA